MRTLITTIVFLASGVLLAQDAATDLDRIQGTWLVASLVEEGKPLPAKELEDLEVVIEKNTFTVNEKAKVIAQYRIKLDPAKTPKAIDFTHLIGKEKEKTEPGIYVFDKDQLKFCLDEKKKGRPTVFEGKETENYSVIVLKKKPANDAK